MARPRAISLYNRNEYYDVRTPTVPMSVRVWVSLLVPPLVPPSVMLLVKLLVRLWDGASAFCLDARWGGLCEGEQKVLGVSISNCVRCRGISVRGN